MTKANAAQVMVEFMWDPEGELPKSVFTGSIERGFEVDQTVLIEYLMKFQEFLYKHQPTDQQS